MFWSLRRKCFIDTRKITVSTGLGDTSIFLLAHKLSFHVFGRCVGLEIIFVTYVTFVTYVKT